MCMWDPHVERVTRLCRGCPCHTRSCLLVQGRTCDTKWANNEPSVSQGSAGNLESTGSKMKTQTVVVPMLYFLMKAEVARQKNTVAIRVRDAGTLWFRRYCPPPPSLPFKSGVPVWDVGMQVPRSEVIGLLVGICSLFPSCGSSVPNSGC